MQILKCNSVRLTLFLSAVIFSSTVFAEDLNDPPWDASLPNQTSQTWESMNSFTGGPVPPTGPVTGEPIAAYEWFNPYGPPTLTFTGPVDLDYIPGPHDATTEIPTWHIGAGGGTIELKIPNFPEPNTVKKIFWQITSDKSPTPTGAPPTTNPPGTSVPTGIPHTQWPVGGWYTYNGLIEIRPNPDQETIIFDLVESTNISEIVIDTVCMQVPEPSTLIMLGMGAVGMLVCGLKRRRIA